MSHVPPFLRRFRIGALAALALSSALAGCAGSPLARAPSSEPQISFDVDAMDAPLACLTQHVKDNNRLGVGDRGLYELTLRVGKFPDRSGKSAAGAPSDNPMRLQSYFQGAVANSGLFTLSSIDDGAAGFGDLPTPPGGTGHAPTDNVATLLLTGVLDGDADVSNRSAEGSLSIGPLQLLFSGNDRVVGQRLYAELVTSRDGTLVYRNVDDPYAGVSRRMHMAVTTNLVLPESGFNIGGSWFGASGDGGILGGGGTAKLARIKGLTLASKAVWFEMLRRMTDSYAASERCLDARARAAVSSFPTELDGVVVGRLGAGRVAASRAPAAAPSAAPSRSVAAPRPQTSAAPVTARRAAPAVAPAASVTAEPGVATASFGGRSRPVSLAALDPGRGDRAAFASFARGLPAGLRAVFGAGSDIGLFNAAARVLENPGSGQVLRLRHGDRWVDLVAGAPVRRPPDGTGQFCRNLTIAAHDGGRARLDACRDPDRPVWRFNVDA